MAGRERPYPSRREHEMTAKEIQKNIDYHKAMLSREKERAWQALCKDELTIAAMAVAAAAEHKGAIEELQFILECMEVEA